MPYIARPDRLRAGLGCRQDCVVSGKALAGFGVRRETSLSPYDNVRRPFVLPAGLLKRPEQVTGAVAVHCYGQ